MKSIYIYPTYTPSRDKSGNLYIKYFHDAYKDAGWKVRNRCWKIGVLSILFNLDAGSFVIQWVDLLPQKRLGKIQFVLFVLCLLVLRLLKKNVIWVLHNKKAHNCDSKWIDWGMDLMAKYSDHVITHSEEGVSFFEKHYPKYSGKCHYIPHPVYTNEIFKAKDIKWDYIIWGGISKRKNIAEFLQFIKNREYYASKRILVCGHCGDTDYAKLIESACSDNVCFENLFLSDDELKDRISHSRCVLFTYSPDSVLSSGALIYSLNYCKPIIGPRVGSFADLTEIVSCYDTFDDIEQLTLKDNKDACSSYINENFWIDLPDKIQIVCNKTEK